MDWYFRIPFNISADKAHAASRGRGPHFYMNGLVADETASINGAFALNCLLIQHRGYTTLAQVLHVIVV